MKSNSTHLEELLLKQIISSAGIVKEEHKQGLKKCFDKKFAQHVNTIQYNQLREDRFILSQKKVLEKQNYSIQRAKEEIALRQNRALANKHNSMIDKSKRVEEDLSKWKKVVDHNKQQHEHYLKESIRFIQQWNDKLSESSSRKSIRMKNTSQALKKKSQDKSSQAEESRTKQDELRLKKMLNPENSSHVEERYNRSKDTSRTINRSSRVSTENIFERKSKLEEDLLEKSLIKTGQKQDKINQARFMKHYLNERKIKIKHEKEEALRKVREHHLSRLHQEIESRNSALDKKYKSDVKKACRRGSLPSVSGKAASILFMNGAQQERRNQQSRNKISNTQHKQDRLIEPTSRTLQPNYDRLVLQKIHDIAHYLRNNKKF